MKQLWGTVKRLFRSLERRKDDISDVMKNRHRFVVMDEETYREKFSFQLTGINIFVTVGVIVIIFVLLTFLLIAFTPLRELIPGYTNPRLSQQAFQNALVIDSLEHKLSIQEQQLHDIKAIMTGEDPDALRLRQGSNLAADKEEDAGNSQPYRHSKEDSLLRQDVENADEYSLRAPTATSAANAPQETPSMQLFFTPLKGKVVAPFDSKIKHYGVDIAGAANEAVMAALGGIVIFSGFTVETGYVIALQHPGNYISVYKHNSALLKHEGDMVRASEPIAYLGNTGEQTSGPHLHFELWLNGTAVNPLQYISF